MIITRALLCTCAVHKSKSQRDVQIYGVSSPPQSLYRISCPLVAKTNTLLPTFVVNVPWLFLFFLQSRHRSIDLDRWAAHTILHFSSSCLSHLFILVNRKCNNLLRTPPR